MALSFPGWFRDTTVSLGYGTHELAGCRHRGLESGRDEGANERVCVLWT